jgi:hypothetical protein
MLPVPEVPSVPTSRNEAARLPSPNYQHCYARLWLAAFATHPAYWAFFVEWVKAGREDGETSAAHPVLQLFPNHAVIGSAASTR